MNVHLKKLKVSIYAVQKILCIFSLSFLVNAENYPIKYIPLVKLFIQDIFSKA